MAESILDLYKKAEEEARLSNLSRMQQAKKIYSDIIERYQPGGAFGRGYEALLERQKTQAVGQQAQRDISRGLYGIRPYEAEFEATVGQPARLKLEDIRMQRLSQSQQGLASFLTEGIDSPYPDFGPLMQAYAGQASAGGGGGYSGGGGRFATGGPGSAGRGGGIPTYGPFASIAPTGGGGGGFQPGTGQRGGQIYGTGITPGTKPSGPIGGGKAISGGQGLIDPDKIITNEDKIAEQHMAGTLGSKAESAAAAWTGKEVDEGPPGWTGNYRTWKAKMDEYNRKHGLPLTGY